MSRHRTGLRRLRNYKPALHALFSGLTRGRPAVAKALDFYPEFGPPDGMTILHDDVITSPMAAPKYAVELAKMLEHNCEATQTAKGIPAYPLLRRVVWEAPDIYIPGRILFPVDRRLARVASFEVEGPTNWSHTRPRPFRSAPIRIPGRAVLIPNMRHYGHLMTDKLAPIAFAAHMGFITPENPVTIVRSHGDNPVALAFADGMVKLGLASNIVTLSRGESALAESYIQCEALTQSGEHKYAMPEVTPLIRRIFTAAYGEETLAAIPTYSRVYLTRGSAKLRQVEGEAALIEALRADGFHIFESSWNNHAEQLQVFSNCDLWVGVHGGGLVNAIFDKPDSRLIEICSFDARKTTGIFWTSCSGADYSALFGGPDGPLQTFSIDPEKMRREILALID
jgi:capsular polysaccharide biosynthesis protein